MAVDLNFDLVAGRVRSALVAGSLTAAAATLMLEEATAHRRTVPRHLWDKWTNYREPRFWVTGDLVFKVAAPGSDIVLYGLRFDPAGLAALFPEGPEPPAPAPSSGGGKGRRPANWWPTFAEELAVYVHEQGVPSGTGTEGQEEMIQALLQRVSDRGADPGRTTIQPVIQAVIDRLRAAGN